MGKHINFLGYSIWIPGKADHEGSRKIQGSGQLLYSPGALAGYSLLSPSIGTILYGMNLCRRDEHLKGRFFIALSFIFIFLSIFFAKRGHQTLFLYDILVASSLYQLEKTLFDRAMRNGFLRARWWPPLIGILILLIIAWLFATLFP
jgi:hypothetical protein